MRPGQVFANRAEALLERVGLVPGHVGEVFDQRVGLIVIEIERRHAHFQPGSEHLDVAEEPEEPVVLYLGPFTAQPGRSIVGVENLPAADARAEELVGDGSVVLDAVAADAVEFTGQMASSSSGFIRTKVK